MKASATGLVLTMVLLTGAGQARAAGGLSGSYYSFAAAPENDATASADIMSASSPTATFLATTVCFPSCDAVAHDDTTLDSFLSPNATDISSNAVADLEEHALLLTGFLTVTASGPHTFELESDDGSELWIGNDVLANDGDHGIKSVSSAFNLAAGVYPIKVLQFEDFGDTGLTVREDNDPLTASQLSTSATPEPAAWALMLGGVGVIGTWLRMAPKRLGATKSTA